MVLTMLRMPKDELTQPKTRVNLLDETMHRSLPELQIALESLHSGAQATQLANSRSLWKHQK
uniref:Uncharacterized protein n=2 Tax=Picea TaxID=3328 RepID=A0A117NI60_PICGL|nr:hypothetical protein ABT39_MTgene3999 [Picea glauca]QHR89693.1 hypothetical protein Q903MT_gene3715 [Picea sitchensis]